MANYPFQFFLSVHFLRGEGGLRKCIHVLYTHLNVDNYGWPLSIKCGSKEDILQNMWNQ